jgi:hypothetical protein
LTNWADLEGCATTLQGKKCGETPIFVFEPDALAMNFPVLPEAMDHCLAIWSIDLEAG